MIAGLEKKNRVLNETERRVVAHHELGHALVAMALPGTDPVHKISIIPRGVAALGYTLQRPIEDRFLMTREELENKMAVLLGGRAAEEVVFGHLSTSAANGRAAALVGSRPVNRNRPSPSDSAAQIVTPPTASAGPARRGQRARSEAQGTARQSTNHERHSVAGSRPPRRRRSHSRSRSRRAIRPRTSRSSRRNRCSATAR